MIKVLAFVSLAAFLSCYGVQSAELPYNDLSEQILNSGTVVFLDFLEKVRNATEKIVKDDLFRKTRINVQRFMKSLREFAKPIKNAESGSQDNSAISPQKFFLVMADARATIREISDKFFFPHMDIYRQSFKNEIMMEIWKGSAIHLTIAASEIAYCLCRVVGSQLLNMIEAGVDTVSDIGKMDFNQLHEEVQVVMDQIRKKAFEISILERQKEKNDFLISLRTASGLIVFYWNKVLEHTESPSFHAKYLDSKKQWERLVRDPLANGENQWLAETFSKWWNKRYIRKFIKLALEYYSHGNEALDLDRFNQSNWAIVKSAVVYSLPVYEKLSEVGFGITEINRFLHRVNNITLFLEGKNPSKPNRRTLLEKFIQGYFFHLNFVIEEEKANSKDNEILLPLRVIRSELLNAWTSFLFYINVLIGFDENQHQQSVNEWNHLRSVVINELLKSKAFTQKQLEEAPKNFIQAIHQILEKLKQYTDLFDDFDENNDSTASVFEIVVDSNKLFHEVWNVLLE
ncbi:uncharacterized protein LOC127501703 isoform X6 [Ctenopharyngodon idella]|uniref:uncharacterized protein LOC127501703 isoform X6 n=1 Tax=Ctenopharyngodon idella TaxID=7959 RepID=UPI00222E48B9|nr:uncharacterized protein LOC127501703 isoform X6 [Ctenopharyngodon idella]